MRPILFTILAVTLLAAATGGARAQEREWSLDAADEDAFLVFGVPETDDVGVSLWCKIGSGKVKFFFPEGSADLEPDTSAQFTLTINDKAHVLTGSTSANEMSGATSIETEMPVTDPLLAEITKASRFTAVIGTHTITFPLMDAGFENLLRLCTPK